MGSTRWAGWLVVGACATGGSGDPVAVTLPFSAKVAGAPAVCGASYTGLGTADSTLTLKDFRLFVHDVSLITAAGDEVAVALDQDGVWQHDNVALLDFEDKTATCSEFGTTGTHTALTGTAPDDAYDGIAFSIGLPFALNHLDTAGAPPPLSTPSMYWVWKAGYKFVRVDWVDEGGDAPRAWNVHLGSGGCESLAPTSAPEVPCAQPNVARVSLTGFDPTTTPVVLDLASLLASTDLSSDTPESPPGCMANPTDGAECETVFAGFGLSRATGQCVDGCAGQTFAAPE